MYGWKGKILRVNLTNGNFYPEDYSNEIATNYIGGRGSGLKILHDEIDPLIDPLGPENKLIFCTGPLTGTGVPAGGRFTVVSKSPLTGAIANPVCGGYFGARLKFAGYDLLIIEGKSPEPVYLYINNDIVELRSAGYLWGKGTMETERLIINNILQTVDSWFANELSIVTIGQGGENLVKFACIMADGGRAAGRSGLGAVMGSKKLKAIVVAGSDKVKIADVTEFKNAVNAFLKEAIENKELEKRSMWGTWSLPGRANKTGTQASFNFQSGYFEAFNKYENPSIIRNSIRVRDEGCFGCPFRCSKRTKITDPNFPGTTKGPEHETMALLGSNVGISDLIEICKANYLCNDLGLDTISTGASISCAQELFEKGIIPEKDIGYPLNFGNSESILRLLKEIALKQGFGNLLAEGGYFLADKYGHPELFMGVKKQGMPAWHPQGVEIIGLQYATANNGACHTKATLPMYEGRLDPTHHIEWTKQDQDYIAIVDSCVLCWIIYHGPLWNNKPLLWLKLVTGIDYNENKLATIGEKIWNLERIFNLRAGLSKKDDNLPYRITNEPRIKNQVVHLDEMLLKYYKLRKWDRNGIPTEDKLKELGLEKEILELEKIS